MEHSIESFEGEYDPWITKWLRQKLMVRFGCDSIPILLYPHNTWQWVGLNWKFMYLSMGSLLDKCHRGLCRKLPPDGCVSSSYLKCLCSPRLAVGHYWGAQLIGEVPVLGYVIKRLWLMIRILSMIIQGYPWRMYQKLWHKCTTSAECKTIRIAASAVMDGWKGHTVPLSDTLKMTCDLKGDFKFWSQQSCGNDTNVPTWVFCRSIRVFYY